MKYPTTTCLFVAFCLLSFTQVIAQTSPELPEKIELKVEPKPVPSEVRNYSPPPPPPMKDKVYKVVEHMPHFPGCENLEGSEEEKKKCANQKMFEYIYANVKYPDEARKNGTEGTAAVQFTVSSDGSIKDIKLFRDPGDGLGQAALDVTETMNNMSEKWIPGSQQGINVNVMFTLVVKFKL